MSLTICQTLALIGRYLIHLRRNPIKTIVRNLIWPGYLIVSLTYLITKGKGKSLEMKASIFHVSLFIYIVFPVWHFTEWLVNDKSSGMKFLMISMGLKKRSYYLANIISFLAPLFPYVAASIWLSIEYLFKNSKSWDISIALLIILFVTQITGFVLVSSLILNRSNLAFIPSALLFLDIILTHFSVGWLLQHTNEYLWPTELFFACFSPIEAIRIFIQSYSLCENCDKTQCEEVDNMVVVSQPTYLILLAMASSSFILYLIVYFFDQFSFHEAQNLKKKFNLREFFGNSNEIAQLPINSLQIVELNVNHGYEVDENDENDENCEQYNSEYFEHRDTSTLEVGIQVKNLTKEFNSIPVVNDVTLNIYKGETTLLLGHNGAGKTTLMNMILGKLSPNQGEVNIKKENGNIVIGVCPQESVYDADLTVGQHLRLFAKIKLIGSSNLEIEESIQLTAYEVALTDQIDKLPSELSGGMKRKLSLALASVGKSSILILDEPSSGLDPESRVHIWETIRKYRTNRTVLLSTQHMEEADYLGDRVAIMSEGRIICCGSSVFLKNVLSSGYKLRVQCHANNNKENVLTFVRKYFNQAKFSDNDQGFINSSQQDVIFELGESKDFETNMINLLEEIENNSDKLGIKSHGLKGSSIEDVLLNTNKLNLNSANKSEQIQIGSTIDEHLNELANLSMVEINYWSLYCALMKKYFHTFRRDWKSILFYRKLLATLGIFILIARLNSYLGANFFLTGSTNTLVIAHLIYYPTIERCSKFKTIQLTSNANSLIYWLAQFSTDLLSLVPVLIIDVNMMLITHFEGEILISKVAFHLMASILVILFAVAASMLAYLISKTIRTPSSCIGPHIFIYCIPSLLRIPIFIIMLFQKLPSWEMWNTLTYVSVAIFPTEAIEYIFYGFAKKCYVQSTDPTKPHCVVNDDLSQVLVGIIALFGQILVFGLILYIVELKNLDLTNVRFGWLFSFFRKSPEEDIESTETLPIDNDVVEESQKAFGLIDNVPDENFSLVVEGINKSYVKGINVVKDLSFTVTKGECFGLLGVNGAGKSTTFSMIAGDINPDQGKIWLNGHYNTTESIDLYRQELGYDPQSNPEMSLSPIEALTLMARLRCVDEQAIPELVVTILDLLEMTQHGRKCTKDLSGGTKRKLTLGMSLIGNPRLLALDEPTAGVDPIARRSIWQLLRSLRSQNGTSIVISSHAMEECEAICDRISIMARGQLRCIGSFLHLQSKFAHCFNIKLQFDYQVDSSEIVADFSQRLELEIGSNSFKLTDLNSNSATYIVTDESVKRSTIFNILKEFKDDQANVSYVLNDTSLEDIFIKLAREQERYNKD